MDPGNLLVDYVLPSRSHRAVQGGVSWPQAYAPTSQPVDACGHRLVWIGIVPVDGRVRGSGPRRGSWRAAAG
jgi:hypothetical protein